MATMTSISIWFAPCARVSGSRIKSTYYRRNGVPFDNGGAPVSVMAIKVTGTIRENPGDGKRVLVDWTRPERPRREWYFSTYLQTVHLLSAGEDWKKDGLIEFAFEDKPQDIGRFLGEPRWHEQYGSDTGDRRFRWTEFYRAVADRLLDFQGDRGPLVEGLHQIAARTNLTYLEDRFADGSRDPLRDICPFTAMGMFNRSMTIANRRVIAEEIANFLGVEVPVPESMEGIPTLNNQRIVVFSFARDRGDGDIDAIWNVLAAASRFVDSDLPERRAEFAVAYDSTLQVRGVGWNLSIGLYWAHPWDLPALDSYSRDYISDKLEVQISQTKPCNAESYLQLLGELKTSFDDENLPVHSFPELSLAAWNGDPEGEPPGDEVTDGTDGDAVVPEDEQAPATVDRYSVTDVLEEGCFLERGKVEHLLERLRTRKNLILQGPPGTGKTWLTRRLAFALIGQRANSRVRVVQFHPNLSYEDFVRGWRPTGDGTLDLADGVFMETIRAASENSSAKFVVVIEEINRGNPAQIFGELLTLLEADKRTPGDAIELCYPDQDGKRRPIYVPENLFVIGTMNIADRSLALVDLAFRRRFAFVTLEPSLGEVWRDWVVRNGGVDPALVGDIERRITELNDRIAGDPRLGSQFRIGHSYVTPAHCLETGSTKDWFRQVVETEIGPLLEEYWFDSPGDAMEATERLLEGW